MPDLNCDTPKDNLKVIPCLQCLSEDQLKLLLIYSMNELFGQYDLPSEVPELLADSACYSCFTQKQLLQLSVTIWATIARRPRGVRSSATVGAAGTNNFGTNA